MKVLHVIPSVSDRSGGPAQAIIPMCRALQEQGTEVVIATTDHGIDVSSFEFQVSSLTPTDRANADNILLNNESLTRNSKLETRNYRGVPTCFFPVQWGDSFKYSRTLAVWLDANVKNFDVVHIHAVFNHACIAAAAACRRHHVPYIVRPLGTLDPWSMKQKPLRKVLYWQLAGKRMLQGAAAVHYTASAEMSAAEDSLGITRGQVIPLGVVAQLPANGNGAKLLADKLPNLRGRPYVLVLSRLHPKKGLDVFIDAFVSLVAKEEFKDWRLVLAGEGPQEYVRALREKVAAARADNAIFFAGWLEGDEKAAFLRHASLLALPSYQENFGLCAMEALAAGVPVLVSPHVNLAAEIDAAGAGWITTVETSTIENTLAKALGSGAERSRRGTAGKILSLKFSWERLASRLTEMYAAVAAPARSH